MCTNSVRSRRPVHLLIVGALAVVPSIALAQEVTLKDAIACKDFKHNADGTWHAQDVSVSYGKDKQQQLNLFGSTTIRQGQMVGGVDLWSVLNEKCGTAK